MRLYRSSQDKECRVDITTSSTVAGRLLLLWYVYIYGSPGQSSGFPILLSAKFLIVIEAFRTRYSFPQNTDYNFLATRKHSHIVAHHGSF